MRRRHLYRLYGFAVSVPFRCTQVEELSPGMVPEIVVGEGPVARRLDSPALEGDNWQAAPGLYLLCGGRRAGRFLVETGGRVTLERNPQGEDDLLAAYFLTHVLAALMRSLGLVVLHGSTVVAEGEGLVLTGNTGAGKSTTQAALLAHGGTMVSDDVTVVRRGLEGRIEALPGVPKLALCEDAAAALGQDVSGMTRNPLRRDKVVAFHRGEMAREAVPLHRLIQIVPGSGKEVLLLPLAGGEKFRVLQECVYGPLLPGEHPAQFALFSEMSRQLRMFRLERAAASWCLDEVVEQILHG